MTPAEFYTTQFYTWECRGRGWFVSETPIELEPPFIPYFRHGYPGEQEQINDGKRHTLVSKFIENIKGKKKIVLDNQRQLDYETIEPFEYVEETSLAALQVKLLKDRKITPEKMKALFSMLSYMASPISFELIGTGKEIIIQFVCDIRYIDTLETFINAYCPFCSTIQTDAYLESILHTSHSTAVVDFGLKHEFVRPLGTSKGFSLDPLIGFFGVLERLSENEQAGMQILFQPALNSWSESILRSVTMHDGTSFFSDAPEAPQVAKEKVQSPFYGVTIRTFAQAESLPDAFQLLERISFAIINGSKGLYNELIPLSTEAYDFQTRVDDIFNRESHRLGMLLNMDELITLLHFPSEHIISKKLGGTSRRTKAAPAIAKNKAFVLGENSHNGVTTPVSFSIEDRLKHTHIIGTTGTGKSTLIANLILQDIRLGLGVVLFDPHGDLVEDIISRIPENRLKDVVLVDPSDIEYPIGLNLLQAHTDIEKEILSSDLVVSFRKYATSWGDQMNAVLGNAIQAILENKKGGTLNDLRRFLIEKEFRQTFLKNVSDPSVLYYWQKEYPLLKTNSIGPILTRLDTFLRPKSIRNMVIQNNGLDFEALFNTNKIILLKLSQGLIGTENSHLLGSLILSKIHQAIFRRQNQNIRNPIMLYLDEFQYFITPSIKEMLSGIRKYNVGLTLSHQDLQQLHQDTELLNGVLSNTSNRIVFRVGEPDAKKLQDGFSEFDFADLQNLGKGEAIIRIEQPQYDCTIETFPLAVVSAEQKQKQMELVLQYCRKHYATPKEEVEKLLSELFNLASPENEKVVVKEQAVSPPKPTEEMIPPVKDSRPVETSVRPEKLKEEKDLSTHRYLQNLVKKMAEAKGYTAVLEKRLPDGTGQVDVLLSKGNETIAVEICNTTDADWEMHNIFKCLDANYDMVISFCGDPKQLEKIKKKCIAGIEDFEKKPVSFFTPDALFAFLDGSIKDEVQEEKIIKGYRVNVTYDEVSEEELKRKRASIAEVVLNSLRKKK